MLKMGIVGCGAIGSALARAIEQKFNNKACLVGLNDLDGDKAASLAGNLTKSPPVLSLEALIRECDLVIEATGAKVSAEIARKALLSDRDVMIMSVGGLVGSDVFDIANQRCRHIYIPSGAICGLDGVKAAAIGTISQATITTRKPPKGLQGAPYIVENKIDLEAIHEETLIFEGSAEEAIKGFPQNVNVAVSLSFAGIGIEKTRVRVMCSPHITVNSHEVVIEGDFGKLTTRTDSYPAPENPKTSYLAILAGIATLKGLLDYVRVGT